MLAYQDKNDLAELQLLVDLSVFVNILSDHVVMHFIIGLRSIF